MDAIAAVSLVLAIAIENKEVDILQMILSHKQEEIVAAPLDKKNNLWRIKFGNHSLVLNQECAITKTGDKEISLTYESLLAHYKLVPSVTPTTYCYDSQRHVIIHEDFINYAVLYDEIAASRVDMVAIKNLGAVLGQLHKITHSASNSMVVRDLHKKLSANPVVDQIIQSTFVDTFDRQCVESLANESVRSQLSKLISDTSLMEKVVSLKNTLLRRKECLSHGLLSTTSIAVKDGEVKILDGFNSAFLAPCSFDLAVLLADYISFYHQHMLTEIDNDSHRQVSYKMIEACTITVDAYLSEMTVSVDGRDQYVENLISDVAGYCGILLIARFARGTYETQDILLKRAETMQSGVRLLGAAHRIKSAGLLVNIALMLTT